MGRKMNWQKVAEWKNTRRDYKHEAAQRKADIRKKELDVEIPALIRKVRENTNDLEKCSDWEKKFIPSIERQFKKRGSLSVRQISFLRKIHHQYLSKKVK